MSDLAFVLPAFSPSTSPCFVGFETVLGCTSGDLRRRLEVAWLECEQYFVTTTIVGGGRSVAEAGAGCQTLHQVEQYFNVSMQGGFTIKLGRYHKEIRK